MKGLVLATVLALVALSNSTSPASAQLWCTEIDAWPSFSEVAPTARSIVLVNVTESVDGIARKARLVEVMKGSSPVRVDLRRLRPGRVNAGCRVSTGLYAQVGDRLAIAFDGRAAGRAGRVDTVAHVGRMRDRRNLPGLERLTFDEARAYDAPAPDQPKGSPRPTRSRPARNIIGAVPRPFRELIDAARNMRATFVRPPPPAALEEPPLVPGTESTADLAPDVLWSCRGEAPGFPRSVLAGPTDAEKTEGAVFDGLRDAIKTMKSEFKFERRGDRPHQLPWLLAHKDQDRALFLVRRAGGRERYSAMYVEREGDRWGFAGFSGDCRLRPLVTHGLGQSDWRIDGGSPPTSGSSSFPVEVMEHGCASGRPANGRIAEPLVQYGEDAITITIPVHPVQASAVTCPGNPWTPFVVELSEPIGDRLLLDGGPWPPEQRWPTP